MITGVRSDYSFGDADIQMCVSLLWSQHWMYHHALCCIWGNWIINVHGANLNLHSVFRGPRTRIFCLYSSESCFSCLTLLCFTWVRHLEKHVIYFIRSLYIVHVWRIRSYCPSPLLFWLGLHRSSQLCLDSCDGRQWLFAGVSKNLPSQKLEVHQAITWLGKFVLYPQQKIILLLKLFRSRLCGLCMIKTDLVEKLAMYAILILTCLTSFCKGSDC